MSPVQFHFEKHQHRRTKHFKTSRKRKRTYFTGAVSYNYVKAYTRDCCKWNNQPLLGIAPLATACANIMILESIRTIIQIIQQLKGCNSQSDCTLTDNTLITACTSQLVQYQSAWIVLITWRFISPYCCNTFI